MINFNDVIDILLGNTPVEQVSDSQGNVLWSSAPVILPNYFYVEDTSGSSNTLTIAKSDASAPTIEVFKSTDGTNWTSMGQTDINAIAATIPANGKLYLKATTNKWAQSTFDFTTINTTRNCNIGGNIMSLLYGDDFEGKTALPTGTDLTFCRLFYNNGNIINAGDLVLPATTLCIDCYTRMFESCTSLTTAPALPATTLTEDCYGGMFESCTSLTTAPALPATTLVQGCYGGMFRNCTSLTTAPALPATTLANYCYQQMFYGCTNLNSVTTYAQDISASNCLIGWLDSVSATGDFYNLGSATYTSGASGIPSGWTEHTSL